MEGYLNDQNLVESKILQNTIQEVFEEFLDMTMQCIRTFGKNHSSSLNIIQKIKWIRYKKTLQRSFERIGELTKDVDREANQALQARVVQVLEPETQNTARAFQKISMIPFIKNPAFSGRGEYLRGIHEQISVKAVQDSGEQQSLVLYGLAGIGKTQVALQYVHLYKHEHDACFWVTCDNRVKISKDIAEMARLLGFGDQDRDHNSAVVKEWMSNTDQSWLLVLDNVESLDDVQEIWPSCNRGSILVSTQDSGTRLREDIKHSIEILSMKDTDGISMVETVFKKHEKSISTRAAQRILKETGGLPFSIRQLCSYICANELDPNTFLDDYNKGYGSVDSWDEAMLPSYQRTLSNFLDLTFKKLSTDDIRLVAQFSFLDPDMVQPRLLYNPSEKNELNVSMRNLHRYSLVSRTTESTTVTYNIHRVVKRHLLSHLDNAQLGEAIDCLTRKLRAELPRQTPWEDEVNNKKWIHSDLIPHIAAINKEFNKVSVLTKSPEIFAQNLLHGAFDLWIKGLFEEGRELIESAMTLLSNHTFSQLLSAEIISFKGTLDADSGNIDEAHACFDKALTIQKTRLEELKGIREPTFIDEIYLANSYNNLAGICHAKGNYAEAKVNNGVSIFLKEKWRDAQRNEGRSLSHLLCLSYQNQANTLAHERFYDEATEMFEKALQEGQDEVSAARQGLTYHNYGCMKLEQNLIEEACALLNSACLKREESLDSHPDTAASQHMLAACYQKRTQGVKMDNLKLAK
ncbi:hypothetical protein NW762_011324 [Fusarium torreyae]|uniref:NB-ARC domain-containing protein n=1 Tax=Fusarium torreyae TaxID=1237075 RepID=A0A9W8RT07_9HYPO|nr:hypothetical protein NW762_011324 [Fusarium torreyae]